MVLAVFSDTQGLRHFGANVGMAFFERGVTGWKLLFRRDQEEPLRGLIRRKIPQVEVDTVGKPKAK